MICYNIIQKIDQLKDFYSSVDDIDYYVGILLENKITGSMFGPTGSCVIADSFYRFRNGDRFFYDVKDQPGSFTSGKKKKTGDLNQMYTSYPLYIVIKCISV